MNSQFLETFPRKMSSPLVPHLYTLSYFLSSFFFLLSTIWYLVFVACWFFDCHNSHSIPQSTLVFYFHFRCWNNIDMPSCWFAGWPLPVPFSFRHPCGGGNFPRQDMQHVCCAPTPRNLLCELRSEIRFPACDLVQRLLALLFSFLDDMQLWPRAVCCCRCRCRRGAIDNKLEEQQMLPRLPFIK